MKSHFSILFLIIILGISVKAQQCCTPVIEYSSVVNAFQLPELTKARDQIKTIGTVNMTLRTSKTFKAGKSIILQPNTYIKIDPSASSAYFKAQIEQCTPPSNYNLNFRQSAIKKSTTVEFTIDITSGNGPFTVIWLGKGGRLDTGYRGLKISVPRPVEGLPLPDNFPVAVIVIDECYGISKARDVCNSCSDNKEGSNNASVAIGEVSTENLRYNMYPNPTSGNLTIDWDQNPISSGEVIVMNKLMQVVYSKNVSNINLLSINLEHLPDDMYFVNVISNGKSSNTKIILKK